MSEVTQLQLKSIADLADSVPEKYQVSCFEILLKQAVFYVQNSTSLEPLKENAKVKADENKQFILPIDIKAFLSQYNLSEIHIRKLFFIEDNEIRPIYKLEVTKKARFQIQLALLLSLENAMRNGIFQTDIEALRQKCIELKSYDKINFMTTLNNNKKLFKSVEKEQPLVLSPDGKSDLADTIEDLTNGNG